MRYVHLAASLLVVALATDAATAADERSGRYTMSPTEGGFVRLDTETGSMSLCARKENKWACEPMPDGQQALEREIKELKAENDRLKDEIRQMEEMLLAEGKSPGGPPVGSKGQLELPSEQDVDKAFDYLERMMRKFRDRLKKLDEPEKHGAPL